MVRSRIEDGLIDPDASRMIADMDAAGVSRVVTLPIDWGPDYPSPAALEDVVSHSLECGRRYPERIIPFAGIDPRRDSAPERVEKWIAQDGARGLKLYPSCGWWPQDDRAMAVYSVCQRYDVPVLFHTGDPLPLLEAEYSRPIHLMPVVEAFPTLRVWLGHAGAPHLWDEAVSVARASSAASLELSVWLWGDSTRDDEVAMARRVCAAVKELGAERLLFGTDHVSGRKERPSGFLTRVVDMFRALPGTAASIGLMLSQDDLTKIMSGNAARDLHLEI
jgi:predicted TIM-barrel fold metal-dependent hydrolase